MTQTSKSLTKNQAEWRKRRAQIVAMYQSGETASAVARAFGISRERVRQIVTDAGVNRTTEQTRQAIRKERLEAMSLPDVLERYRNGEKVKDIATDIKIPVSLLREVIREESTEMDYRMHISHALVGRGFSEEEAISAIQKAAAMKGADHIGSVAYDRIAKEQGWPRSQSVANAFGSWNEAIERAGLVPQSCAGSNFGVRKYSEEDIGKAMRRIQREVKRVPTNVEYDNLAKPGEPTMHAIRARYGSWVKALEIHCT